MLCNCEDWLTVLCLVMSGLAHMTTIHYSTFNLLLNVVAETEPPFQAAPSRCKYKVFNFLP